MAKETKVILTTAVANLGQSGDVVEVKPGYARNYLIPQGMAFAWNKGAAKQIEQMQRRRRAIALASREDAVAAKNALEGSVVELSAKVSESGKLFGGISADAVAKALTAGGNAVEAKAISMDVIKTTGEFPATVQLHPEISANFTVKVVAAE
ncbi:50S ribosomal protein L9 [Bifidobacterium simiarum]|uniref:Large ribosomal subunit protein bL9 n=1 Tax=Bifidobacterium simiarum TaxID=2045441 RepID=A0A2M9HF08_9BIFI|nr:50S ribosomal protein L9 [Bifidobacterium simiarum]MBT1165561.1 50S ribosomal protein L9 [Bifidobacterium simiarum]PJM75399.1 50S ribosomal protein L9 [Bifidobacterium simiarum]